MCPVFDGYKVVTPSKINKFENFLKIISIKRMNKLRDKFEV